MAAVKLGDKEIGSIVKLKFNGILQEFLVVHKGIPSSIYDKSCDGVWLLMKNCYEHCDWHSSDVSDYANSTIHAYLNDSILKLFEPSLQPQVKLVKLPYRPGNGTSGTVNSGADGLSAQIFLLSAREVGFTKGNINRYICDDGSKLDYFIEEGNRGGNGFQKRIAMLNGSAKMWWLRSPNLEDTGYASVCDQRGYAAKSLCSNSFAVRPAMILSSNLQVFDNGMLTTNTAPATPTDINIPQIIQSGVTITIAWSTSMDMEENLEGYIVERSTDGGSS